MVAKNTTIKTGIGTFQKKYAYINTLGLKVKMGGATNSVKLIKVNGKLVLP
jgi:hypothetical protein